jgi:hypothetical protein
VGEDVGCEDVEGEGEESAGRAEVETGEREDEQAEGGADGDVEGAGLLDETVGGVAEAVEVVPAELPVFRDGPALGVHREAGVGEDAGEAEEPLGEIAVFRVHPEIAEAVVDETGGEVGELVGGLAGGARRGVGEPAEEGEQGGDGGSESDGA